MILTKPKDYRLYSKHNIQLQRTSIEQNSDDIEEQVRQTPVLKSSNCCHFSPSWFHFAYTIFPVVLQNVIKTTYNENEKEKKKKRHHFLYKSIH
ncbi:LOW QUALITY PROTEIN: hypothetical protein TorRG33x02_240640 [Trema orientale]|uniref:Uncharacterized protein n=1 Tax=Trema orientale TaxID=63057 RepID=A0A2P5DVW2_TREOI|nr:LOW QUALITY PROTEIN: hypothetical protein TorRG33x02_240640 [Trema orientale]